MCKVQDYWAFESCAENQKFLNLNWTTVFLQSSDLDFLLE